METAHPTTHLDADLDDLAELVTRPGPALTAVLEVDGDVEQASDRSHARWSAQRKDAEELGATGAALEAIDPLVADAHLRGPRLYVVAGDDGVRWCEPMAGGDPALVWGPLPSLLPVIDDRQRRVPILLARCDRRGVDLSLLEPLTTEDVGGFDDIDVHERKVHAGGWSQRRYQQRAENSLEGTAADISDAVAAAAKAMDARGVVVLVGDDRTIDSVVERLPDGLDVRRAPGGRAADGSDESVLHEVDRIRDTVAAERTAAAMRELRERLQRDQAVEGIDAVLLALAEARVQQLLVASADDAPTARFDPTSGLPALDDGSVTDIPPIEAPAPDVAVRAAVATGASIRVLPGAGGPADGIGALLRWDEPG